MGLAIKIFVRLGKNKFLRISSSAFEHLHNRTSRKKYPKYAGKIIKAAYVFVEYKDRIPIKVLKIDCHKIKFAQSGLLDFKYLNEGVAAIISLPQQQGPHAASAWRNHYERYHWALSPKEKNALIRLALHKGSKRLRKPFALHYLGLISNPTPGMAEIDFGNGFKVEKKSFKEIARLLRKLDRVQLHEAEFRLVQHYACAPWDSEYIWILTNRIEFPFAGTNITWMSRKSRDLVSDRESKLIEHVNQKMDLLRLLHGYDVELLAHYFYNLNHKGKLDLSSLFASSRFAEPMLWDLEQLDIAKTNEFLRTNSLPLPKEYLQLALENFDSSYGETTPLAFLSLAMALEVLFNPGKQEIKYQISRGVAVLNGKTAADAELIFKTIQELYNKRSKLVHTGNHKTVNETDVTLLRTYVRQSILRLLELDLSKNELMQGITKSGFGAFVHNKA